MITTRSTISMYTHNEFNIFRKGVVQIPLILKMFASNSISKEFFPATGKKHSFSNCNPLSTPPGISNARNPDNKGLVVFIHGLNSTPKIGSELYKKEIETQADGEFEVWVPKVPEQGNCSLEKASKPILEMVRKYIETNPGKPVQLIGHSNGGRIAAYIETHLRDTEVDIRMTGIAGVFFGSDAMNLYKKTGTAHLLLSRAILEDLQTASKTSKKLIEDMSEPVTIGSREYTFYASVNDLAIPNFSSCLPRINQNEKCHIVFNCGHTEIQEIVYKGEVKKVIDFLRRHALPNLYELEEKEELLNEATISA